MNRGDKDGAEAAPNYSRSHINTNTRNQSPNQILSRLTLSQSADWKAAISWMGRIDSSTSSSCQPAALQERL